MNMDPSNLQRHQLIESLATQNAGNVAEAAVAHWEQLATQIIAIVGEGGFHSLFARSLFLTQASYPWLTVSAQTGQKDQRFTNLKQCLEAQTPAQASAANSLLLVTFTDILTSLIGEGLTTSILRSAWGINAFHQSGKESKNE